MTTTAVDVLVSRSLNVRPRHRNLEYFEISGGDRRPPAATVKGTLTVCRERTPDDAEWKTISALEGNAARGARVHDARDRAELLDAIADDALDGFRLFVLRTLQ